MVLDMSSSQVLYMLLKKKLPKVQKENIEKIEILKPELYEHSGLI